MYQPRTYRKSFNSERFKFFTVQYRETDLWIGVDHRSFQRSMADEVVIMVRDLWERLETYFITDPGFKTSLVPCCPQENAPPEAIEMAEVSARAGIGPMSAVAGLFSEKIGKALLNKFRIEELVVENGGDIFMRLQKELIMSVYAGDSRLSGKIGIRLPAGLTPVGVCTSSGTVGPSLSFGIADAVMIACKSTSLADAFATAFGNKVTSPDVIGEVLKISEDYPEILSIVCICGGKMGIRGNFEAKFL